MKISRKPLWHAALLLGVILLSALGFSLMPNQAVAQKKGGGSTTPPPPGTILFDMTVNAGQPGWYREHWGVTPSGTGAISPFWHKFQTNSSDVVPSSLVYGTDPIRDRLWLTVGEVQLAGGQQTYELFACRLDGNGNLQTMQLTALYPFIYLSANQLQVCWANDGADSFVSFHGRSFGAETAETPIEEHDFSDDLTHVFRINLSGSQIEALFDQGTEPRLGIDSIADGWIDSVLEVDFSYGSVDAHHWSPDATNVVYRMPDGLWVAELDTDAAVAHGSDATFHLVTAAEHTVSRPQWSPNGQQIAYSQSGRVRTVKPDGTASVLVLDVGTFSYGLPVWSPDSGHLAVIQFRQQGFKDVIDVVRVPAGGGSVTVLSGDLDRSLSKLPCGWVSNVAAPAP